LKGFNMKSVSLIAALLCFLPFNANALELPADFRVNISLASYHTERYRTRYRQEAVDTKILGPTTVSVSYREYFDEENPGIGGEIPFTEKSYFAAGVFDNSLPGTTPSLYAGIGYDLVGMSGFALCAEAFAASGYDTGSVGGDLCSRIKIAGDSWAKLHYAPGKSFNMGTDVYALEYQFLFN
jgi:hypothetical protein